MSFRTLTLAATFLLFWAGSAPAQALKLEFQNGTVNLVAQNVPARAILAEWARLGGTRIVNAERIAGAPLTLELTGVSERQALDIVLRGVAGYMIAAREASGTGASRFDRIVILPTSTAPRQASAPAPFGPPPAARPVPAPGQGVEDEAAEDRAEDDPRERPIGFPGRGRAVSVGPVTGGRGGAPETFVAPQPDAPPAGRGAPGAATTPSNPFTTLPGSARPGEISPAPPQQQGPGTTGPNTSDR